MFDVFKPDAMLFGRFSRVRTGIALIVSDRQALGHLYKRWSDSGRAETAGNRWFSACPCLLDPDHHALVLLYWLMTRKWHAAAWLAGWLVFFSTVTVLATGVPLFKLYVGEISRLGHLLLVSQNNQSFAAWFMARFYPATAFMKIDILPLPAAIGVVSSLLMVPLTAIGGYLDLRRTEPVPIGTVIALLSAMIFAPIAWTHYSILLIAPVMLLVDSARKRRGWRLGALAACVLALNYPPLATDVINGVIGRFSIVRGQFFAGLLCVAGLLVLAIQQSRARKGVPQPQAELIGARRIVGEDGRTTFLSDGRKQILAVGKYLHSLLLREHSSSSFRVLVLQIAK